MTCPIIVSRRHGANSEPIGPSEARSVDTASTQADDVIRAVLRAQYACLPALIVPSPPGAGKTDLVEKIAAQEAGLRRRRCVVVTQTNQQAFELIARLRRNFPAVLVVLYRKARLAVPNHLVRGPRFRVVDDPAQIPVAPCIVVSNASKLSQSAVPLGAFDLMVVDEAWQLPNYLFLTISGIARRIVLVGDPGQIAPVIRADVTRWTGDMAGPHVSAPQALLITHPDVPVIGLPVSRRLVDDTARIIQRTFYQHLPFTALFRTSDRRLEFRTLAAADPSDGVLGALADGQSLVRAELPPGSAALADPGVAASIAHLVHRTLERGAYLVTRERPDPVEPTRIGVVCAHRAQVRAVRSRLAPQIARHVLVETANRFQGLERDLMIAWHPLTGRVAVRDFHVDAGRFCVMLSRHRAACIVVSRAGIEGLLEHYTPTEPPPLGTSSDLEFDGWSAHRAMLEEFGASGRTIRLPEFWGR